MNTPFDTLLKIDLSNVAQEVIEGLRTKKMILSSSQGNVYWAANSGHTGIVAHLPLIPVSPQEFATTEQLLKLGAAAKSAQTAALAATAVSTAIVLVAIVAATAYIAKKIDALDKGIKSIESTIKLQDKREYLRYLSDYGGSIVAARELLNARTPAQEIATLAEFRIDKLAESRQQLSRFLKGLLQTASSTSDMTAHQYGITVQFVVDAMDLIPSAIALERDLALVSNKPSLAQSGAQRAAHQFRQELAEFVQWREHQLRQIAMGEGGFPDELREHESAFEALQNSLIHDLLLDGLGTAFSNTEAANEEQHAPPADTTHMASARSR